MSGDRRQGHAEGRKLSKLSVEQHYYIHVSSMAVASADGRDAMIGTSCYAGLVVTKIEKLGKEESE